MSSFLNNSGDIILDAVLTEAGRQRLAKGDGSFNIDRFALGDDEINYQLYDSTQATAYKDLNILKTPILEAITNSGASLKHKLMTIEREDLLYLPVFKLNTKSSGESVGAGKPLAAGINDGMYVVLCTNNSYDAYSTLPAGFIDGRTTKNAGQAAQIIPVDQGIDNNDFPFSYKSKLDEDLNESHFVVNVDNRFGKIVEPAAGNIAAEDAVPSFIDTNNAATYFIVDGEFFFGLPEELSEASVIAGSRGERFKFGIRASDHMANSTGLFTKYGYTISNFWTSTGGTNPAAGSSALAVDTVIRVSGAKTGASIDIPVRFIREP